jgi:SAM-dependent methyltransferase
VTSMITPPLSISASPLLTRIVPISAIAEKSSFRSWGSLTVSSAKMPNVPAALLRRSRMLAMTALDRLGLLGWAYRVYEAVRSRGHGGDGGDGLPLPPARLRVAVAGTPDATWFIESGRVQAQVIEAALARHGSQIGEVERMLDFGCGCGRVTRHWATAGSTEVYGSDFNPALVRWCATNLGFGHFSVNGSEPPLSYESDTFDVVYLMSVLTHLTESATRAWIDELSRVLKPAGLLLLTTHGNAYADRLTTEERERYAAGEVVVRWPSVAGTNLCTVFHPTSYVRSQLAPQLELLEFVPRGGAIGSPQQDLALFRRPSKPVGPTPASPADRFDSLDKRHSGSR